MEMGVYLRSEILRGIRDGDFVTLSFAKLVPGSELAKDYDVPPVVTRLFGAEAWVGAEPFKPDWTVFFGLASCGLLAAMISSVPNVLNCRRLQITVSLGPSRDSGSKVSAFRRGVLAGIQVCMSAVLLVTAVALLQLFSQSSSPGMDTSQLFIADLTGNETGPATLQDAATLVGGVHGVESVAYSRSLPLVSENLVPIQVGNSSAVYALVDVVSSDYFQLMGIPVVRGRPFGPDDQNSSLAKRPTLISRHLATAPIAPDGHRNMPRARRDS